jgi:4-carboxymuconolactone decarboxylase
MSDDSEAQRILDRNRNQASTSALDSHPQLRAYVQCFLETFLVHGRVDPRLREFAILRIAWRCNQPYEWAQHYKRGLTVGVTDADALGVRTAAPDRTLDEPERLVVRAADEVIDLGYLTPETYRACGDFFDDPGVLHEFVHLVAGYRMMATILNTTRPSIADAGLPEWPPDGVGPSEAAS